MPLSSRGNTFVPRRALRDRSLESLRFKVEFPASVGRNGGYTLSITVIYLQKTSVLRLSRRDTVKSVSRWQLLHSLLVFRYIFFND